MKIQSFTCSHQSIQTSSNFISYRYIIPIKPEAHGYIISGQCLYIKIRTKFLPVDILKEFQTTVYNKLLFSTGKFDRLKF